jgi:hypothetical protein
MQIDIIDNLEKFKEIRENWDSVYAADPQASVLLILGLAIWMVADGA